MFSGMEVELLAQAEIDGRRRALEDRQTRLRRVLAREPGYGRVGVWATASGRVRAALAVVRSAGARTAVVR